MVMNINIKLFGIDKVRTTFRRLPKNIRKEIGKGMFKIAKNKQRGLRTQLRMVSKRWNNEIFTGIKARKMSDNRSIVVIPQKGVWLDSMKPHWVPLNPGWDITKWANARGYKGKSGGIFVRPHPFILRGLSRGEKGKEKIYKESMRLAINNSRR